MAPNENVYVNFHIGMRDILPTYLEQASALLAAVQRSHLVKQDVFKNHVRPNLIRPWQQRSVDQVSPSFRSLRSIPERAPSVVFSQHAFLGISDFAEEYQATSDRSIPSLQKFDGYFKDVDLRLHIAVVPQHDFGPIIDGGQPTGMHLSWARLVERVLTTVPSARVNVWVFEDSQTVAQNFAMTLLDVGSDLVDVTTKQALQDLAQTQRFARPVTSGLNPLDERSIFLDDLFDRDLDRLTSMPRVQLMQRPGRA